MKIRVTWGFAKWKDRECYFIRKRGWVPDNRGGARNLDSKEQVPDDLFDRACVPARTKSNRGDTIAAGYAAQREREINDEGRSVLRPQRMTLRELGELRLKKRRNEVAADTIERERGWLESLCRHLGADADPSALDISALEDFRDARLDDMWTPRLGSKGVRKISPRTVYNECSYAVALVDWGYSRRKETGMTEKNLFDVPMIIGREGRGGARVPSLDEFWRAYDAAAHRPRAGAQSQVILALGFGTWLRLTPLTQLQQSWIDRRARTVTVPAEFMKGGRRDLTLPLNNFALAAIDRALALHPDSKYVLPVNPQTERPPTNLFHTLAAIARDAELVPFSMHGIRKLGATTMQNHRCDARHAHGIPKIVADTILAHAIPQNDDAYYKVSIDAMRDALSVVDEVWEERNRGGLQVVEISARRA